MQVTIKTKAFSLSGTKKIFLDNDESYVSKSETLTNQGKATLTHKQSGYVKSILLHEATFFNDWFDIRLLNEDNILLKFRRSNAFTDQYESSYGTDKYEITDSDTILKNGTAIAYWLNAEKILFNEQDTFEIMALDNKNLELIITLCLFIHLKKSESRNSG